MTTTIHNLFIKLQIMLALHWTLAMVLLYLIYNATLYTIICDDQLHVKSNLLPIENSLKEFEIYIVLYKDVINNTFKDLNSYNNQRTEELIKLITLCNLLDHELLYKWQFPKNVSDFRDPTIPVNIFIDLLLNIIRDPHVKLDPVKRSIAEHLVTSLLVMKLAHVHDEPLDELLHSPVYDLIYNKTTQKEDIQRIDPYTRKELVTEIYDMLEDAKAFRAKHYDA